MTRRNFLTASLAAIFAPLVARLAPKVEPMEALPGDQVAADDFSFFDTPEFAQKVVDLDKGRGCEPHPVWIARANSPDEMRSRHRLPLL